jgi:hypothetical protein
MGLPEESQSSITAELIYDTVCLVGDTPILMADGIEKRLDSLKAGDLVMDIDGAPTEVLLVKRGSMNPYHTIYYFEDGYYIDEASTHRFFNVEKGFWEHLSKWEIGQHARDFNGKNHALLSKERLDEPRENFGLFTESGRYFASGLLSGPAKCNRDLLKNATLGDAVNMVGSIKNFQAMDLLDLEEL